MHRQPALHGGVVPADQYLGAPEGCVCEVEVRREEIEKYSRQKFQVVKQLHPCSHLRLVASARQGAQHAGCMQVEPHASSGLGDVNQCVFPEDRLVVYWSSSPSTEQLRNEEHI